MEMIVADIITTDEISVIGILTDLKNTWNIFWLDKKKVIGIKFTHQTSAIKFIQSMVLEEKWTSEKRHLPLPENTKLKQTKFDNMFEKMETELNDVACMEDFYDEMTEEEICQHKIGKAVEILKHSPSFAPFFFESKKHSQ